LALARGDDPDCLPTLPTDGGRGRGALRGMYRRGWSNGVYLELIFDGAVEAHVNRRVFGYTGDWLPTQDPPCVDTRPFTAGEMLRAAASHGGRYRIEIDKRLW
jgi:hypothetical protein